MKKIGGLMLQAMEPLKTSIPRTRGQWLCSGARALWESGSIPGLFH